MISKKELGNRPTTYNRLSYKYDGAGYLPKERWHIWTVDVTSGETIQLTEGLIYDETSPTWSPDGNSILFLSNRSEDPELDYDQLISTPSRPEAEKCN